MNLKEAEVLAKGLMQKHLGNGKHFWRFKWSKAKRSFGTCSWGRTHVIALSSALTELNDVARVTNTILHEIAHALDVEERGTTSHDHNWNRIARSIGCDGERCYSGDEVNTPTSKYSLECDKCGTSTPKHRKPKRESACRKCCKAHNGGKFSSDYLMELKEN